MEPECSSSDDDEVVISLLSAKSSLQNGSESRSNNNNNDVELKLQNGDRELENDRKQELFDAQEDSFKDELVIRERGMEACRDTAGISNGYNMGNGVQLSDSGDDEENLASCTNPTLDDTELADVPTHVRKNYTFPYSGDMNGEKWLEHLPPFDAFHDAMAHLGKRFLPPIKKVAKKKHRTLSDSRLSLNDMVQDQTLPTIEGSPTKKVYQQPDLDVKFQVGDDDLSDQETFDTSTSTDHVSSSSSSLDAQFQEEEQDDKEASHAYISENLQGKLLKVLKLEKGLRSSSPSSSIASAPVFSNEKRFSLTDEDDNQSIASDSKLIRSRSDSGRKRSSRKVSSSEDLIIRRSSLDAADFIPEPQEEEEDDSIMKSSLGDRLLDYDEDEVSETPSTRSTGILPAIPSHGTRERNFLVGNLTKHGSLLGADELNRYFPDRTLKLFVGTWNMQRRGIPRNLNDFLLPKHQEYLADMYVIGIQESTQDQKRWEVKLQETLGVNHVLAHSVSHGVLHMSVFVRRDLIWFCSPFEEDRVTTRMVSQIKTKGAVAIAFQFFGTSMIFITSHFHSGETRVKERIEDYNRIKEKIKLPKRLKYDEYKSSSDDVTTRFDCTFWFGDLNFRVSLPHQIIHDEVNNPDNYDLKEVLKGDQLMAIMKRGRIFSGFAEPKIKFRPTYKFAAGTDKYDTSPKMRVPSYTDRILYKTKESNLVSCVKYDSVPTVKKSDHRPVYGFFEVCLKPGRDSIHFGGGKFRNDVYEKAARLRAQQGNYQSNNSTVCNIL